MFSPREAKAIGVREALSWLKDHNFNNIIIEMDAKQVFDSIKGPSGSSAFHAIIDDCKTLINEISCVKISFIRRSVNQVAHSIAKASASISGSKEWLVEPPPFIIDVMQLDLQ